MHYHCEVIMPKTKDIEGDLKSIMKQFSENGDPKETSSPFWDFYVVGGRFAGSKETCAYDSNKLDDFYKELNKENITVSGLQCGKQTLQPKWQIPIVDALWCKFFPTENGEIVACPIFSHSNDQYDSSDFISCDICLFEDIPKNLKCPRVIIAGLSHDEKSIKAQYMICDSQWNGVNHMPIDWDGKVKTAIDMYLKSLENYKDEWREKQTPQPEWICVTVDYHS